LIAVAVLNEAAAVERLGIVRVETEGLAEVADGAGVVAGMEKQRAAVLVGKGVIRIERDRCVVVGQGSRELVSRLWAMARRRRAWANLG
jgi:hypothetical protein